MPQDNEQYSNFNTAFTDLSDKGYIYDIARSSHLDGSRRKARGNVAERGGIKGLQARGLAKDPNYYDKLKNDIISLEQDKRSLSEGNMSDMEKFAMQKAIDLVEAREGNNATIRAALTKAKASLHGIGVKGKTQFGLISAKPGRFSDGTLFDNINKAVVEQRERGGSGNPGDSPTARALVREQFSGMQADLNRLLKLEDPIGQANERQVEALVDYRTLVDYAKAQGEDLGDFYELLPHEKDTHNKVMATWESLSLNSNESVTEEIENIVRALPQGTSKTSSLSKDVLSSYEEILGALSNVSGDMKRNIPLERAYDLQIASKEALANADPFALQAEILAHPHFDQVAGIIGFDPNTEYGRKSTVTFIRQGGTIAHKSMRTPEDVGNDMINGKIDFSKFYDTRLDEKDFSESTMPPPPESAPAPEVDLLEGEDDDPNVDPEVDLLEGEDPGMSLAEEAAYRALNAPDARADDTVADEIAANASDMSGVDVPTEEDPLLDDFSDTMPTPSTDSFGNSGKPNIPANGKVIQSFRGAQSDNTERVQQNALETALNAQKEQRILERASRKKDRQSSVGSLPNNPAAESVTGSTEQAYSKALDILANEANEANATDEAQTLAANALYRSAAARRPDGSTLQADIGRNAGPITYTT